MYKTSKFIIRDYSQAYIQVPFMDEDFNCYKEDIKKCIESNYKGIVFNTISSTSIDYDYLLGYKEYEETDLVTKDFNNTIGVFKIYFFKTSDFSPIQRAELLNLIIEDIEIYCIEKFIKDNIKDYEKRITKKT